MNKSVLEDVHEVVTEHFDSGRLEEGPIVDQLALRLVDIAIAELKVDQQANRAC